MSDVEISVHDNVLYGYSAFHPSDGSKSYTIILYTKFSYTNPAKYTNVVFTNVFAHRFDIQMPISIIFDIEEVLDKHISHEYEELFDELKNDQYRPKPFTTVDALVAYVNEQHIRLFFMSTSYGMQGWIWAKEMKKLSAPERTLFV